MFADLELINSDGKKMEDPASLQDHGKESRETYLVLFHEVSAKESSAQEGKFDEFCILSQATRVANCVGHSSTYHGPRGLLCFAMMQFVTI